MTAHIVSPDGETVWAVSGHNSTAVQIDASTYTLLATIPTGVLDGMMTTDNMPDEIRTQMEQMHSIMSMILSDRGVADSDGVQDMEMSGGHAMQPISSEGVPVATETVGRQPLKFRLEGVVKVFALTAQPVLWNILDDVTVTVWTYNATVPGPLIRVTEGDQVRINFTNNLPEPTTLHWHGINVPNAMDGVPGITQEAIQAGETFTYDEEAQTVRLLAAGKITEVVWDNLWAEWQDRRKQLRQTLKTLDQDRVFHVDNLDAALQMIARIGTLYNGLQQQEQKELLRQVIERVVVNHEGSV